MGIGAYMRLREDDKLGFTRLRGKDKLRFSGHPQKALCRYSAILVYAFRGSLLEGAGSAVLFRRDWRSFDFGFCFALDLIFFRVLPRLSPRALRGAENIRHAVQHSFRQPQKHAAATSLGEGGFKGINRSLPFSHIRV